MRLRLDPWPADYEAPVAIEEFTTPADHRIDCEVETHNWVAVPAEPVAKPVCFFVDGVRRVEARVLANLPEGLAHGLFGSLAAGFVESKNNTARIGEIRVRRFLIMGSGQAQARSIRIGSEPVGFEAHATPQNSPSGVLAELQSLMRSEEAALAESLTAQSAVVFVDGLSYRATGRQEVVGVIKRIVEPYLDHARFALVEQLCLSERTPIFAIVDSHYDRYSCFLRLAMPRPVDHPLAGVVRLEIGAAVGIERARRLFNLAANLLPRFASTPQRDPRAPQNLLPVGALESEMRRRLGDPLLIRRAIERDLHEQGNW